LGRPLEATDRFELRAPGKGNRPYGRVLARAATVQTVNQGCSMDVGFQISPHLGRFSVDDQTSGGIWFGFDTANLPMRGWEVTVIDEGAKQP
jgi:hypothetical protein